LLRARQTARAILALQPQLRLQTSALLNEVYTPYQGLATREVDALDGDVYTGCGPPFEQPQDVLARVQTFARRVRRLHAGGRVAAVTHGDAITFMVLWAGNLAVIPDNKRRLQLAGIHDGYPATASVTTLTYRSDRPEERPTVTYRKAC
jgi:broad specificity phosphatase PhoE